MGVRESNRVESRSGKKKSDIFQFLYLFSIENPPLNFADSTLDTYVILSDFCPNFFKPNFKENFLVGGK